MFGTQQAGFDAARTASAAFWSGVASTQAAGVTIALRLPIFFQAATDPFAWPARREATRAATEKWEAAVEGVLAAAAASATLWRDAIVRPGDVRSLTHNLGVVHQAALRPARRRVRGNARRLTGG
ncbi:MAG: hypothetical protein ABWZ80_06385 [Beijerinckiaceae bacterium]